MPDTRHKSFGARKLSDFEPLSFDIEGETFACRPAVQGEVIMDFLIQMAQVEGSMRAGKTVYSLLERCMEPAEYARFREFLKNPDLIVEMQTIIDIATYLTEEYISRPTSQDSSSPDGETT